MLSIAGWRAKTVEDLEAGTILFQAEDSARVGASAKGGCAVEKTILCFNQSRGWLEGVIKMPDDLEGCAVFVYFEDGSATEIAASQGDAVENTITGLQQASIGFEPTNSTGEMVQQSEAAAILIDLENRAQIRTATIVGGAIEGRVAGSDQAGVRSPTIVGADREMVQNSQSRSVLVDFEDRSGSPAATLLRDPVQCAIVPFDQIAFRREWRGIKRPEGFDRLQPWLSRGVGEAKNQQEKDALPKGGC